MLSTHTSGVHRIQKGCVPACAPMCVRVCVCVHVCREEWGNPADKAFYDYMKSYSPMDTIQSGVEYPHVLATGGLHDPRVGYWEVGTHTCIHTHTHTHMNANSSQQKRRSSIAATLRRHTRMACCMPWCASDVVHGMQPAKFVARLRASRPETAKRLLLLKMEMGAGHFSVTGRFEKLKQVGVISLRACTRGGHELVELLSAFVLALWPLGPYCICRSKE